MPKQEGQKSKLLALLRIFERQTDSQHRLNVPQLIDMLAQQDIVCERKSIYSDIETLRRLGYDIELQRGRGGGYWMERRTFDLAELKLLVDAVQSSRFIPEAKSLVLIQKLESLTSIYEARSLQRAVYVSGRAKTNNNQLLYNVDALHEAISAGVMVRFRYKRGDSNEWRTVSPWQMAWENGCYYLIAYQDERSPAGIRHYRVDRMAAVKILDLPRAGREQFESFDLPAYLRMHFNMYGGQQVRVTLRCTMDIDEAMRERFGREPVFIPDRDSEHFHFDVQVCVSDQFFGWVSGFGGKVEIVAPAVTRRQFRDTVMRLAREHE